MGRFLARVLSIALPIAVAACATGTVDTGGGFDTIGAGGGDGAGGGEGDGGGADATTSTASGGDTTSGTTSSSSSGAGGAGGGGEGGGGAGTGGGGAGGGGPSCDFTSPNQCANGEGLQGIDGDQNDDIRTASGTTSKWFRIFVAEGVSSIISYPALSYTVTLQSPPNTQYDLYVYDGDGNAPDCLSSGMKGVGTPQSVSDKWGDSIGSDDGKWIAIEVRHVSGDACGPSDAWNLTVEGHTQ